MENHLPVRLSICFALGLSALLGGGCAPLQPEIRITPESIASAANYSRQHADIAFIVHRNGIIQHEHYNRGGAPNKRYDVRSITKAFWGVAASMAESQGVLNLSMPASETLPEWRTDPRKSRITLEQLLRQTGGLEPGFGRIYRSRANRYLAAIQSPSIYAPGQRFRYGPAHPESFGEVFRRRLAARGTTPQQFISSRILGPLGITSARFMEDNAGNYSISAGLDISPYDLLRFGRFIEQRGSVRGFPVAAPWTITRCEEGSSANPAFGYGFWTNVNAAKPNATVVNYEAILEGGSQNFSNWERACFSRLAPSEMIVLLGSRNQRVYIVRSLDLVVVRLGAGTSFRDDIFLDKLLGG